MELSQRKMFFDANIHSVTVKSVAIVCFVIFFAISGSKNKQEPYNNNS